VQPRRAEGQEQRGDQAALGLKLLLRPPDERHTRAERGSTDRKRRTAEAASRVGVADGEQERGGGGGRRLRRVAPHLREKDLRAELAAAVPAREDRMRQAWAQTDEVGGGGGGRSAASGGGDWSGPPPCEEGNQRSEHWRAAERVRD